MVLPLLASHRPHPALRKGIGEAPPSSPWGRGGHRRRAAKQSRTMGLCVPGSPYLLPPPGSISRGGRSSSQRKHKTSGVCPPPPKDTMIPASPWHARRRKQTSPGEGGEAAPGCALAPRSALCSNLAASEGLTQQPALTRTPAGWTGSLRGSPSSKRSTLWLISMSKRWSELLLPPPRRERLNHSSTAPASPASPHSYSVGLRLFRERPRSPSIPIPIPAAAKGHPDPPPSRQRLGAPWPEDAISPLRGTANESGGISCIFPKRRQ